MPEIASQITCVDCGGVCHRHPLGEPELGWQIGDVVTYRCEDCADMWYVELESEDLAD